MLIERLHTLGSKADRLLMYPSHMNPDGKTVGSKLLHKARDECGARLKPIEVQRRDILHGK